VKLPFQVKLISFSSLCLNCFDLILNVKSLVFRLFHLTIRDNLRKRLTSGITTLKIIQALILKDIVVITSLTYMPLIHFRLEELQVLDIKFLYGCSKPTIGVLYQVHGTSMANFILG
jgi:hypothetical protein